MCCVDRLKSHHIPDHGKYSANAFEVYYLTLAPSRKRTLTDLRVLEQATRLVLPQISLIDQKVIPPSPFTLLRSQGCEGDLLPMTLEVQANFSRMKAAKRKEYLRARLEVIEQGSMQASLHANQSSGALSVASWSNGFAVQSMNETIANGDKVEFIPFSELFS